MLRHNKTQQENIMRMKSARTSAAVMVAGLGLIAGCTTMPDGPSVMVLPGTGKSFDQFRADDMECRQFASSQVGGATASTAQADSGVRSAAVGTAIGAIAGAAMDGGHGAGVGAGAGLLMGSMAGAGAADVSGRGLQRRYDVGYQQCMYAKGHRIPVYGRMSGGRVMEYSSSPSAPSAAPVTPPPPPPGNPPPPPRQ
jgi:hypothetical protein